MPTLYPAPSQLARYPPVNLGKLDSLETLVSADGRQFLQPIS